MLSGDLSNGNRTPPLRNNVSSDLESRLEDLLKQERKIAEEYDILMKNRLTEDKMLRDIQERESSYHIISERINGEQEKLHRAKTQMESDRKNIEMSRPRLRSEEDSYQEFYSDFLKKCQEIDSEHNVMEDEFAKIITSLTIEFDILQNQNNDINSELDLMADDIRKAEESAKTHQANVLELQKVRVQITEEENRANHLQESIMEVSDALKERAQMITQAEHQIDAIRNQYANEKRIHEGHIVFLSELEKLSEKADKVAGEYKTTKDQLILLEKTVQQACENELNRTAP